MITVTIRTAEISSNHKKQEQEISSVGKIPGLGVNRCNKLSSSAKQPFLTYPLAILS